MKPSPGYAYGQEAEFPLKKKENTANVKGDVIVRKEFDADGGVIYDNIERDPSQRQLKDEGEQPEEHHGHHVHHHHQEAKGETSELSTTQDETIKAEEKNEENKPEETKPGETQPEETKLGETQPEETKPGETQPEETKPGEAQPEETKESEQVGKPDKKNKLEEAKNGLDIQDDVHDETNAKNHLGLTLLTGEYLKGVDVKTFLMSPAPKGYLVQCSIKREKGGLLSYSKYFLSLSHQPVFLMGAKKQKGNKSSNYAVGTNEKDFSKKAAGFLGKVRSNFVGTEFIIYDHGLNPKKSTAPEKAREQLGAVLYESNVLGSKGPRKMKVLVPDVKEDGEVTHFKPASGKEGLVADFQAGKVEGFKVYINKSPKWNDKMQAFVLNFHGRVKTASVKNFQLIDEKHDEKVLLQFGRTDKSHFIMDYQWPLTAYQAFSICLSSFDYKLACE